MIAYEIQLWHVIWNKIQSETKSEKKKTFCQKKKCKKFVSAIVSDFQCAKWAVSDKSMLIITKRHTHTAITVKCIWKLSRVKPVSQWFPMNWWLSWRRHNQTWSRTRRWLLWHMCLDSPGSPGRPRPICCPNSPNHPLHQCTHTFQSVA